MEKRLRPIIAALCGLGLSCAVAHAQLHLSGHTTGSFVDPMLLHTTVVNGAGGSSASFTTGVPYLPANPANLPTSILFGDSTFANISSGQDIQVGLFTIHNGSDLVGTDAAHAVFNFGVQLTSPTTQMLSLGTIDFSIDNTVNSGSPVPDLFNVTFTQPAPVMIDGTKVNFHINFTPLSLSVPENTTLVKGDVVVTFSPAMSAVPEASTFALWGAAALLGLIAMRWLRSRRSGVPAMGVA